MKFDQFKRILMLSARILWVAAIPILIISGTVNTYIGSLNLYKYGFNKYEISKVTNISNEQLEEAARIMIRYFDGQSNSPQVFVKKGMKESLLYNNKELTHLEDVRKIIWIFKISQVISLLMLIAAGIFLFIKKGATELIKRIRNGAIISLGLTGALVIWAVIDFEGLFYLFHLLSFNNYLWLLDPTHDYLIMMFPQGFFFDAAILIVGTIILESVILIVAAQIIKNLFPGRKEVTGI